MRRMLLIVSVLAFVAPALADPSAPLDGLDSLDLNQAKTAAAAAFDQLDVDHRGALGAHQLKGRISKKDWAAVDPDNSGAVRKNRYLAFVEVAFKVADKNSGGKVDKKELRSPAGQRLERLMR